MKTKEHYIDDVFDFAGIWEIPSRCGLKINKKEDKTIVIVSELYQENPGTSVTQAAALLAKQICDYFSIVPDDMIYIEHNPSMNSKLSFYEEEFFLVQFEINNGNFANPKYQKLQQEKIKAFIHPQNI